MSIKINEKKSRTRHLSHDKIHAVLVGLLGIRSEPEPLHGAFSRLGTLSTEVGRHRNTESSVVGRELCKIFVGIAVKLE